MRRTGEPSSAWISWGLGLVAGIVGVSFAHERELFGFLVGAALGVLLAQVIALHRRTSALREELEELRGGEVKEAPPAPKTPSPQPSPIKGEGVKKEGEGVRAPLPLRERSTQSGEGAAPRSPPPPRKPPQEIPFIRWLKGGNPFARLGIAILFIAGVLAVKYAAEHSAFPVELRFILIAAGALVLLIVGWRLREKRGAYAHLLQGGGIAGLYLTVFAATRFFHLLPFGFALALMIVIAVAAAVLAVAQDAQALAVVGTAGGFLAPVLLSTGSGNYVALFTYYAVLNVGVFTVAWFRAWRPLNVLSFIFTFTITGLWRANSYQPENLVTADAFLILFFVMYVAISILNSLRQPANLKGYVSASLVFGLPVVAFTLHGTLISHIPYALAWSALGLGLAYVVLAFVLYRTRNENLRLLVEAFAALGVIFASLAVPLAFDRHATAAMWSVEGAGSIWFGIRQHRRLPRAFGALLQVLGGLSWLYTLSWPAQTYVVLNGAYIGTLLLAISGLASGLWLFRNRASQATYEIGWDTIAACWGLAWWLFGGLHEIDRGAPLYSFGIALGFLAATALALTMLGRRLQWPLPQQIGLYLPAVAAVIALAYSTDRGHPFFEWGGIGWAALLIVHYTLLRLRGGEPRERYQWLHAVGVWIVALTVAWEVSWQLDRETEGVWEWLGWGLVPALLLAFIARRKPWPEWPLAVHRDRYLIGAARPLVWWSAAWVALVSVASRGDSAPLPYVPLLNPLDLSVMLICGAVALWWTALDEAQRQRVWMGDPRGLVAFAAALIFLWLNSALIRALHYSMGAPLDLNGIMQSVVVQAALSIFWGLLGFVSMVIAGRKRWRVVWIVGATLMCIVILKLFAIDLSGRGTLARIISFLTVGALLLVTGYLSPLPPRSTNEEASA